jgi:GGDEF domain-containing protein
MNINIHKISDTGLYHEEVFKILTEYELARAQRYPNPITLLHIALNLETAKPEMLSRLKQLFAGILNTSLRVSDIPAHHGADFLVLLPMTDGIGGQAVAQRLITRLKGTRDLTEGIKFKFTIHIGISSHPGGQGISAETLMVQAETALKEANKQGPEASVLY